MQYVPVSLGKGERKHVFYLGNRRDLQPLPVRRYGIEHTKE
jgi:hypothetical protein